MKKVSFNNGSSIILEDHLINDFFDNKSDITVETLSERENNMTAAELRRSNNEFTSLVGAIDAKWAYQYQDVPDQPEYTDEMRDYLDEVARAECDFDPQY
jgi:hypothetical protein